LQQIDEQQNKLTVLQDSARMARRKIERCKACRAIKPYNAAADAQQQGFKYNQGAGMAGTASTGKLLNK
jgi:hypothetical protein